MIPTASCRTEPRIINQIAAPTAVGAAIVRFEGMPGGKYGHQVLELIQARQAVLAAAMPLVIRGDGSIALDGLNGLINLICFGISVPDRASQLVLVALDSVQVSENIVQLAEDQIHANLLLVKIVRTLVPFQLGAAPRGYVLIQHGNGD